MKLYHGDCLDILPTLAAESVDSCVTDPPYFLGFMGLEWDTVGKARKDTAPERDAAYRHDGKGAQPFGYSHGAGAKPSEGPEMQRRHEEWAKEVLRVLKPGAHLVAFGSPRTFHRLMCAIEDAGFEIIDCLMWLHGQGFPKAKSQLKPAWEPIILARKTGNGVGLNIDGCRIAGVVPACSGTGFSTGKFAGRAGIGEPTMRGVQRPASVAGRWPANVVLSHESSCQEVGTKRVRAGNHHPSQTSIGGNAAYGGGDSRGYVHGYGDGDGLETMAAWECVETCAVRMLDEQSGERKSGGSGRDGDGFKPNMRGEPVRRSVHLERPADSGGASRYFLTVRADITCLLCDRIIGPKHDTMNETHSEDHSCEPAKNADKTSDQIEMTNDSALRPALQRAQPESAGRSGCKITSARSAESPSENTPGTNGHTAQSNAVGSPTEQLAQAVRYAVSLCALCATATARSLVATRLGQSPASLPCLASISEPKRQILIRSLALLAESQPNTDTMPTTASLKMWSGYVRDAIASTINSASNEQSTEPAQTRFRYLSKASRSERGSFNRHPTVKPLALLRWLVRLVTPPGGTVLDPFLGSGTTALACQREGFECIGIEIDEHSVEIARRRLIEDSPLFANVEAG